MDSYNVGSKQLAMLFSVGFPVYIVYSVSVELFFSLKSKKITLIFIW